MRYLILRILIGPNAKLLVDPKFWESVENVIKFNKAIKDWFYANMGKDIFKRIRGK